jgi:hypothetical protein
MLEIIIAVFVFCIILFFYLHIHFHLKTSNDLEIYEIEQASKDKMEEICDLRQPVLFDCDEDTEKITKTTNKSYLLENYPIFEVKIRESHSDKEKDKGKDNDTENLFLPLPLHIASKLFLDDKNGIYFSEGNMDFLTDTGAQKNMSYNDEFLRPFLVSNCNYDVLMGSSGVETPLRYEINYRNYFLVTQGSIKVKLFPPKSGRYLYLNKDYENLEFRSPINPWNPQTKFRADFDKVKCLEIVLTPGKFLFIPAYWWYSFKFAENTSISSFKYRTYMNNIAISPHIFMYALQNQNVERKTAKQIDIKNLNHVENKETTNISELNTKSDTSVIGEENVVTNMSVKNEVTDAILNTLDTENFKNLENLDTLEGINSNPFVSSI